MARINLSYQEDGQAIKAVGDVFRGWQEWEKGFGYFGRGLLEFPGGWSVTVDLQVRARPNDLASLAKEFPRNLSARYGDTRLYYSLEDYKLAGTAILLPIWVLKKLWQTGNLLGARYSNSLEWCCQFLRHAFYRIYAEVAFL